MKSLYFKITLWTLAAFFLSAFGAVYTMSTLNRNITGRPGTFSRMAEWQRDQAVRAYEQGGKEAVRSYLKELRRYFSAGHYLVDAATKQDLVSGEDRSELAASSGNGPRGPYFPGMPPRRFTIVRPTEDGKYLYLVQIEPPFNQSNVLLPLGIIFLFLSLFSYGLFRYLASPLRKLSLAVERFGQGDLNARVDIHRNDEIGALGLRFNQMADRLQTLLAAERRLLEDVSHELRSPLARMQFALAAFPKTEATQTSIQRLRREIDRLGELVSYLLQVTRAEGDPGTLRQEEVELADFVQALADECAIEAEAKHCVLKTALESPLWLTADRELLRRAIENVLRNAIRYAPEQSEIVIELSRQEPYAHLTIRDQGPGVPDEMLTKIFQPFFRVDSSRSAATGGVGLGLAITQRAVALHKGKVEAINQRPGLAVSIDIPLAA
jgi:two-component system sensor histidine kinase CpxA